MEKMLHNLINSIVDLGGGLRLQPRGTAGSYVEVTDEQAASEPVQKMLGLRKVRLMGLEEHAQYLRVMGKAALSAPAPEATPAPAAKKSESEKPREEPKEEPKEEAKVDEPAPKDDPKDAPAAKDEDTPKSSKGRKSKKSRKSKG